MIVISNVNFVRKVFHSHVNRNGYRYEREAHIANEIVGPSDEVTPHPNGNRLRCPGNATKWFLCSVNKVEI